MRQINGSSRRWAAIATLTVALGCGSGSALPDATGGAKGLPATKEAAGDGSYTGGGTSAGGAASADAGGGAADLDTQAGGTSATDPRGGAAGSAAGAAHAGASAAQAGNGAQAAGKSAAAEIARKLGRASNFLIGMGNDLQNDHSKDGAYTLGQTLDLHYAYLVASMNNGVWNSWKDWNADGGFVDILTDSASKAGVVPMLTLYEMRALGDGNLKGLTDNAFQKAYWSDVKLMYQHLGKFDKPSVVHFEPDFWGYAEQQSKENPSSMKVNLTANAPDCAGLSNDLIGMGHCLVKLARMYAPKAIIGFHVSEWAATDPKATVAFLNKVGADSADVVFADLLDRDAGCFEAGTDPECMRSGKFYWDETNTSSPNFHEYLAWSKAISSGIGRPMIWWQIPFGVPSNKPGGTAGHYRDNRVHYIFSHIQEFVDAGGVGATFGTGAGNQTYIDSDGGQFKNAVAAYYKNPVALP